MGDAMVMEICESLLLAEPYEMKLDTIYVLHTSRTWWMKSANSTQVETGGKLQYGLQVSVTANSRSSLNFNISNTGIALFLGSFLIEESDNRR